MEKYNSGENVRDRIETEDPVEPGTGRVKNLGLDRTREREREKGKN